LKLRKISQLGRSCLLCENSKVFWFVDGVLTWGKKMMETLHLALCTMVQFPVILFFLGGYLHQQTKEINSFLKHVKSTNKTNKYIPCKLYKNINIKYCR
jgi:hypothetical protein